MKHFVFRVERKNTGYHRKNAEYSAKSFGKDGLINRNEFGNKPPLRVEYSLTEFGKTLVPALDAIAKWGRDLGEDEGELVALDE